MADRLARPSAPALAPVEGLAGRRPSAPARPRGPRRRRWLNSAIQHGWDWLALHGATGPTSPKAARFGAFGDGSYLAFPPGATFGERWIHIGDNTLIGTY